MAGPDHWQVSAQLHGAPVDCELQPDDSLRPDGGSDGNTWQSQGDHAAFQFGPPAMHAGLPAGWYEVRGRLDCLDGIITLPSLTPTYARDDLDIEDIPLPDPKTSGKLHALVLFKYPVSELQFCPGVWAARFRMHDFTLRRVSRVVALWMMLRGAGQGVAPMAVARRVGIFMSRLITAGLRAATDAGFAHYTDYQRPRGLSDYDVWVRKYDTFTPSYVAALQQRAAAFTGRGTSFSVLMPVTNMSVAALRRRIDNVCQQLWGGWELCVVGDATCGASSMDALRDYAAANPRIHVASALEKHAAGAFNRALDMATASHVIVLGADVTLRRHALLEMADVQRRHADVAFAYADEDEKSADGRRAEPYFKPDWNPDLLRSQNYIGPFAMIRTDLAREVGGLRDDYGDSALHDLFLRCTERLERSRICHVARILYHRHPNDNTPIAGAVEAATRYSHTRAAPPRKQSGLPALLQGMLHRRRSSKTPTRPVGAVEAATKYPRTHAAPPRKRSGLPALLQATLQRRRSSKTPTRPVGAVEAATRYSHPRAAPPRKRSGLPALLQATLQRHRSSKAPTPHVGAVEAATRYSHARAASPRKRSGLPALLQAMLQRGRASEAEARQAPGAISADGARAVVEHLARRGIQARVDPCPGRCFHVHWPLPSPLPKICVVIPTRDRADLLRTCIQSLLDKTTWSNFEIVVVDNQSSQLDALDYLDSLRHQDRVRVLHDDAPFNYAAINNRAVAQCDGELVCLLNNDIEVITPAWLEEMAGHALRPDVGAVGAMLYYPDDTIQHAGVILGMHGVADHIYAGCPRGWPGHGGRARVAQELSAVTGACLLVRRSTYLDAGGLDERLAVAFNDVDFCLRLHERGLHNIWTPHAELYHHESASRGRDDTHERQTRYAGEIAYMRRRWPDMLRADPAYNPNLSLHASRSEFASPPRLANERVRLPLAPERRRDEGC